MAAGLALQLISLAVFFAPKRSSSTNPDGSRCRQGAGDRCIRR